jgi:predicted negative regulator of RcsB-dependent stress response
MSEEISQNFINALKEIQKANFTRSTRWNLITFAIVIIAFCTPFVWHHFEPKEKDQTQNSWQAALDLLDVGGQQEALSIGLKLIKKSEHYYYAHSCLGDIQLANGNVKEAEEEYQIAYNLFPNDKMEADLKAIKKRILLETNK